MSLRSKLLIAALVCTVAAFAQVAPNPAGAYVNNDIDEFQVNYATNLSATTDSYINITNNGASGAAVVGSIAAVAGPICVQVYAFDPSEEMLSCCTCPVTPNGLMSIPVYADLIANSTTGEHPSSAVIKLVATSLGTSAGSNVVGTSCVATTAGPLIPGMRAWGTKLHAGPAGLAMTETEFSKGQLSAGEYGHLWGYCSFITPGVNPGLSGHGICAACALGGLGASTKL